MMTSQRSLFTQVYAGDVVEIGCDVDDLFVERERTNWRWLQIDKKPNHKE